MAFDATDDPVHGNQLGRFFHGYYQEYCFLPLYLFCGDELLGAWLRPADIDGAAGSLKKLAAVVRRLREAWPNVKIVVRGDSGFCRDQYRQLPFNDTWIAEFDHVRIGTSSLSVIGDSSALAGPGRGSILALARHF